MSRKEMYYLPVKNYFSPQFLTKALNMFNSLQSEGYFIRGSSSNKRDYRADIFHLNSFSTDMMKEFHEYKDLYGSFNINYMVTVNAFKHVDIIPPNPVHNDLNTRVRTVRTALLNMPLNDHSKYGNLNFYDKMEDKTPAAVLNYAGNVHQPYLLNVSKIHETDRRHYPSITLQFEYKSYEEATKILSDRKLLSSNYHP